MRVTVWLGMFAIVLIGALLALATYRNSASSSALTSKRVHVLLVGASIGQSWRLAEWPIRVQAPEFSAESIPVWQFDKGPAIEQILRRPHAEFGFSRTYLKSLLAPPQKPDVVILKECSSYFPGDLDRYQSSIRNWVDQLRAHRIRVVLATVVPITEARALRDPGKQESLLAYNHWLRQYARSGAIPVVDLEASVATDGKGRYLRDEFTAGDGSHLNPSAYAVLDQTLLAALRVAMPAPVHL